MNAHISAAQTVVNKHLQAFLQQKGVGAILEDYADHARFYSEARMYRGKQEIAEFFTAFLASLPPRGVERFSLRSFRVEGNVAYITWNVGSDIPLGTDTFVVENNKIVSQSFAMYTAADIEARGAR
jgi:hypothetical protein